MTSPLQLSPFVPASIDSESDDADPPRTSLALSDRLAGDQQDSAVHARGRTVRALSASARSICHFPRRCRRRLVGRRDLCVAGWPWPSASLCAGFRAARSDPNDAQARVSGDRAPQSRSDLQRTALARSRRALPAMPHNPRRARASPAPLVECLSPACARRPLFWPLQLEDATSARARSRAALAALEGRMPAALRFNCSGGTHDRNRSKQQDDRDGATAAGR